MFGKYFKLTLKFLSLSNYSATPSYSTLQPPHHYDHLPRVIIFITLPRQKVHGEKNVQRTTFSKTFTSMWCTLINGARYN